MIELFKNSLANKTHCDEQLKIINDRENLSKQADIASNNLKSIANRNKKAVENLIKEK